MNLNLLRKNTRISFPLVRVDDRLLHGQVIVGWGQSIGICPMLLVSDRVTKDTPLAQTLRQIVPEEQQGDVITLEEAAERWKRGDFKKTRAMLVLETPVDALRLIKLGFPMKSLTLGGLHYREDREEFLPYIFLSEWDFVTLEEIMKEGVRVFCQDLPATKPVPFKGLA
jgi:PTS system mannose-specific IIB component